MNIPITLGNSVFKARRKQFDLIEFIVLVIFGVVFVGCSFFASTILKIDDHWIKVSGKVVGAAHHNSDDGVTYSAIIQYQANGQVYKVADNSSSSMYPRMGEVRQVAYNPSNPDESKAVSGLGTRILVVGIPFVVGAFLCIFAPILLIKSLKRSFAIKRLQQTGQKVSGVVIDIISSKNGYAVVVGAPDNAGGVRNYTSDGVSGAGGFSLLDFRTHPIPMDVYVDTTNPNNYYVDISEIPNLTPERITELIAAAKNNFQSPKVPESFVPNNPSSTSGSL